MKTKLSDINLYEIETKTCSGSLPEDYFDQKYAHYFARTKDWDARKAEALLILDSSYNSELEKVRTYLMRGKFSEASNILENVVSENKSEVMLEKARLTAFNGEWLLCLKECNFALSLDCRGVTRLALLQVKSLALFELGNFDQALQEISLIETMSSLFPNSQVIFYSTMIKVQVLVCLGRLEEAFNIYSKSWNKENLNLDKLLTLLRVDSFLRRHLNKYNNKTVQACYLIADKIGDRLYRTLALFELNLTGELKKEKTRETDLNSFSKIQKLESEFDDIEENHTSTSAKSLKNIKALNLPIVNMTEWTSCKVLFFPQLKKLINLENSKIIDINKHYRMFETLNLLTSNLHTKESLTRSLWNTSYSPEVHANLFYKTISRLQKMISARVEIKNNIIRIPEVLRVDILSENDQ